MAKTENRTITVHERINKELNIISWAFKCQFMEASKDMFETPILHSNGRYLASCYYITSNLEIFKLQDYIEYYTNRFENINNSTLLKNELLKIYEKANSILQYYNDNLTVNCEIVKQFSENTPENSVEKSKYFSRFNGEINVEDLDPQDIVFGKDCENSVLTKNKFNYLTDNGELASFCQKFIEFIDNLEIIDKKPKIQKKTENRLKKNSKNGRQQSNEDKTVEVSNKSENFYPHIFRNNAFEVWQSMYDSFGINEKSRANVKFIYEKMKKDGLIFNTVNQKTFLDWISQTYQIVVQKTSYYSKTVERESIYSNAKQLYKALDTNVPKKVQSTVF